MSQREKNCIFLLRSSLYEGYKVSSKSAYPLNGQTGSSTLLVEITLKN